MTEKVTAVRLDLIEAMLFELLRQATPAEAVPFVAQRLASKVPTYTATEIIERLTSLAVERPEPAA